MAFPSVRTGTQNSRTVETSWPRANGPGAQAGAAAYRTDQRTTVFFLITVLPSPCFLTTTVFIAP